MGYQETTGATSRQINLDFATDKTVKQGTPESEDVGIDRAVQTREECAGEGEQGRIKIERKEYKRGWLHVKRDQSGHSPG